jgi:hypothetical protein
MLAVSELGAIAELTGCRKPCKYKKYSIIGEKTPTSFESSDSFTVSLWAVSNDTTVEKEVLIYSLASLMAGFGGTLGLFLGFSFMALWDGLAPLVTLGSKAFGLGD